MTSSATAPRLALLLVVLALCGCGSEASGPAPAAAGEEPRAEGEPAVEPAQLERLRRPFTGDLGEIRQRRHLRVLVSYSKTNFFYHQGRARGFEHELISQYAKTLNASSRTIEKVHLVFIPTPFDRLLEDLAAGLGDVAAAGLTVTEDRKELVVFTEPYLPRVDEVVVTHRSAPSVAGVASLAGRAVHVRAGSSYVGHLAALSRRFESSGEAPIEVVQVDADLTTEDVLELTHAGVFEVTVADRHLAEAWAEVLPDLVVSEAVLHSGGQIAWAVRKDNPELRASLDDFVRANRKGSLLGNVLYKRYYQGSQWIRNPLAAAERAKLEELIGLFQEYGERYGFDWLALAAQAYQESGLDQSKKSRAGAVGVMQIKPSTAADDNVRITGIDQLENNVHAGVKYLAFLRDRYFADPAIEPAIRVDFAWAAYNAGPARIRRLRQKAAERGFDPNRWFFHVEKIAAEEIGRETVEYVANVNKYYAAYRLQYASQQRRRELLESERGS